MENYLEKTEKVLKLLEKIDLFLLKFEIREYRIESSKVLNFEYIKNQDSFNFYRMVTWLYILYYETGKKPLELFKNHCSPDNKNHYDNIKEFRTLFQHSLGESDYGEKIKMKFQVWRELNCESFNKEENEHWKLLLNKLLDEVINFLSFFEKHLEDKVSDEYFEDIKINTKAVIKKEIDIGEVDKIIKEISIALDIELHRPSDVRKEVYQKWVRSLNNLKKDRKRQEYLEELAANYLLTKYLPTLMPLKMAEIESLFNVKGKQLGELYKTAKDYYIKKRVGKDELITYLKAI